MPLPEPLSPLLESLATAPHNERVAVLEKVLGRAACRQIGLYPFPPGWKLSVVIPVYNEERWLDGLVKRVQAVDMPKELILVNDRSTDGTPAILDRIAKEYDNVRVFHQPKNMGKGAALREGFKHCTGDAVIVQDADWEYDPAEYPKLVQPILDGQADVVFGSRFIGEKHRVLYFWHSLANHGLTLLSNIFTDLNLTDMETCYKVFRREVIQSLDLKSDRFGFEPEVTAKVARKVKGQFKWRVFEVPISYSGRTYAEGKKIGLKDAFNALWCIIRFKLRD
ncbi:MAG: glycosyltransferase family 2 protein [Gemmataceae bacterium]|nr:glycosyltransferase family 2 protein [Planctomycetia bacterium]MBX3399270.1 glycosyltransferase family 2 protein [Gemmataceae bacterium]